MKVLHVMGRFAASGTERQLASTLQAALRHGLWEPTLCVLRTGDSFARELADAGVQLLEFEHRRDADPRRLLALEKIVHSGGFDVVHSSLYGANALTRLSAARPGRPAVVVSERRVEDWRTGRARSVDRVLRRLTDAWIGNSPDVGDFIARAHGAPRERVHVIPNGIDTGVFSPAPAHAVRDRAGRPLRIGSVGRLVPVKGYDVLIEACRSLQGSLDAEYVVVGEGPERTALERRAAGLPVSFPGELREPGQVAGFLRTLDLFVLPSRSEGLPNVVLEAAACGVPVVATHAPGVQGAAEGAVLVPADDVGALAEAVRALALHPVPARPLSAQSYDDVARAHAAVFAQAMDRRWARRTRRDG